LTSSLRVLHVEDSESDAAMVQRVLQRGGHAVRALRIETEREMRAALRDQVWDLIIADYRLPKFDAPAALQTVRDTGLDIPFIVVSGTIGEELAVEMMRAGANDYLMKDNLSRLGPVIARELAEVRVRIQRLRAEQQALLTRETMDGLVESAMDAIIVVDDAQRILLFNPAAERMFGYRRSDVWNLPLTLLMPERHRAPHQRRTQEFAAGGGSMLRLGSQGGVLALRSDGTEFPIEISVSKIGSRADRRYTAIVRDVSARVAGERRITRLYRTGAVLSAISSLIMRVRSADELYRSACSIAAGEGRFSEAWIGVLAPGETLRVETYVNAAEGGLEAAMAALPEEFRDGSALYERLVLHRQPVVFEAVGENDGRDPRQRGSTRSFGIAWLPIVHEDATVAVLVLRSSAAWLFDDDEIDLLRQLAAEISFALEYLAHSRKVAYLAYYDALTGMANRSLFEDRVNQHLRDARAHDTRVAIAVLALDRIKSINNTYGREAGDDVLKQVAERLRQFVPDPSLIARTGADEFAVVVSGAASALELADTMAQLNRLLGDTPVHSSGHEIRVLSKIGIALHPEDGPDAQQLLTNAEAAVREAHATSVQLLFYDKRMTEAVARRVRLENMLHRALQRDEFVLHYQPKCGLLNRRIEGYEALIRWRNPELGLVPPMSFLPLLEENGQIVEVGNWVVRQVLADRRRWRERGIELPRIAVNISAVELRAREFVSRFANEIREHGSAALEVEISEGALMRDIAVSIDKLESLRDLGVQLAVDDFGSGHSSLAYLARLPARSLKVDRIFIATMLGNPNHAAIVSTVITLAHSLGLQVVAEGVESQEVAAALERLGCDYGQGYWFGAPAEAEQAFALLESPAARDGGHL
jgi:diguanylate cyclase (GGDEF)-like protein/PAS domain S-box-containing protein